MKNHAAYERRALKAAKKPRLTLRRQLELKAEKRFIRLLDKALDAAYEAGIENRGDVLTLPINDLWLSLAKA